ncbi:MAG: prefoldin subunit beta [Thaumarchaeota archaeon]|nr:prefoldin subunit beta [Nitrososphaerota archaeon]
MSEQELPPWLREQLARYEQMQQNLQAVMIQKQQVDMELAETDKALEELKKAVDSEQIYKYAGNLLVKVSKEAMLKDLTEKKELAATRTLVLQKQEARFRESLKDIQTKIDQSMKQKTAANPE